MGTSDTTLTKGSEETGLAKGYPLKPCSKCGREWANPLIRVKDDGQGEFLIHCGNCGHEGQAVSLQPAIDAWNAQSPEATQP